MSYPEPAVCAYVCTFLEYRLFCIFNKWQILWISLLQNSIFIIFLIQQMPSFEDSFCRSKRKGEKVTTIEKTHALE